jgi:hypothetical protein
VTLFVGSSKINREVGNFITFSHPQGYAHHAYNFTPDLAENDHFNLTWQGNVRLLLQFSTALTQAEFEIIIKIDRSKKVICDFAI